MWIATRLMVFVPVVLTVIYAKGFATKNGYGRVELKEFT